MMKFKLYNGELNVEIDITEEKKTKVLLKIIEYCIENECVSGEKLHQNDECIINAPIVLGDIIDDILEFNTKWDDKYELD